MDVCLRGERECTLRLHRLEGREAAAPSTGREPAKVLDGDRNQSRDRPPDLAALWPMGGIYTSVVAMVTQAHTFSAGVPLLFVHLKKEKKLCAFQCT